MGSAFLSYKNVIRDVRGLARGERLMVSAAETGEVLAARILRPENKSYSQLQEVVSLLSQT